MTYLVYEWRRPCGTPFYVGMGQGNRPWKRERGRWANSVRKSIESAGGEVEVVIVGEYEEQKEAFAEEVRLIALYGRLDLKTGTLANMTDGGEGCQRISPESLERMRKAKLGIPNPKLSASQKGKPATDKQKEVLLHHAKQTKSVEHREKVGAAHRGKKRPDSWKKAISEGLKRHHEKKADNL